jgi:hypothetical protein
MGLVCSLGFGGPFLTDSTLFCAGNYCGYFSLLSMPMQLLLLCIPGSGSMGMIMMDMGMVELESTPISNMGLFLFFLSTVEQLQRCN